MKVKAYTVLMVCVSTNIADISKAEHAELGHVYVELSVRNWVCLGYTTISVCSSVTFHFVYMHYFFFLFSRH